MTTAATAPGVRNDPRQYDELAEQWWDPRGAWSGLHWLAPVRAELLPPPRAGALLVDVACGGGLLAPYARGYRHVGVDLSAGSLAQARRHGVEVVRADATALPLRDGVADVVVAGEVFEHVADVDAVVAEIARVLRPGGALVCDTINATWWARFSLVTVCERLPGVAPRGCHDPSLFVPPARLVEICRRFGIDLQVRGLGFSVRDYAAFLAGSSRPVRLRPTRSTAALYQGFGRKSP